ncbi:MAG TPA: hypothetical protein VD813_02205 [Pseudonocardia sp.]|nr:hypothetical protein [Pseudonocardia sp.]
MSGPGTRPARARLGFGWPVLVLLAALAAPRVVLHDLGVVREGELVNALLVFVPPAVWIAAVLWRRPPRPFATLLVVGALYGVFLAVGHQLAWSTVWDGRSPALGGNLADLPAGVQEVATRSFAVFSSVATGMLVGAVAGAVALLLERVRRR